ncbi:MAG: hypothetical protein GF383_08855 [Candidatus Lokiarchaeota archaeon]|nr:hypothetical protein [Candidatus Lokiarchaeota archaeon]MBD3340492.1 hypothetical protein [Candidatus Lokiarchaeota archaeon]
MALTGFEILQGSFSLLFAIISIIVGVVILSRYFSLKRKILVPVGFTWIFMSSVWWSSSLSFISLLIINQELNPFLYLFIGNIFVAPALLCWVYVFTTLAYSKGRKVLIGTYSIICISYEIFLIIFFIIDPSMIGTVESSFYYRSNTIVLIFQIFAILTTLVTGIKFSITSMRSENDIVRLKGRFLLAAFLSFSIGAALDALLPLTPLTLIIIRLILTSSAIEYYLGFLLPEKISDWLIN